MTRGAVLRGVRIVVEGRDNHIEIGANVRLSNFVVTVRGDGHRLEIGRETRVWGGTCDFFDSGCTVRIGERSAIYGAEFGASEGGVIELGSECLLAAGCDLRNGDSHSILDAADGRRLNPAADVILGEHVWLGARVIVLKGSRVGPHTVVGAGSIVAGELPEHCVAVGIPAKPAMTGTTWTPDRI